MSSEVNIFENSGYLVITSREFADNFGKRHDHVLRDIDETIQYLGTPQNWGHLFIASKYQHPQNKQWYREYLMTRDGFSLLVMGFTGVKALQWKIKYINAFNAMEAALGGEEDNIKLISLLREKFGALTETTSNLQSRMEGLEFSVGIDYPQQLALREVAGKVAREAMGGASGGAGADKSLRRRVISQLWKDYKGYFAVNSYRYTVRGEFDKAKEYLKNWKAQGRILREIENSRNL